MLIAVSKARGRVQLVPISNCLDMCKSDYRKSQERRCGTDTHNNEGGQQDYSEFFSFNLVLHRNLNRSACMCAAATNANAEVQGRDHRFDCGGVRCRHARPASARSAAATWPYIMYAWYGSVLVFIIKSSILEAPCCKKKSWRLLLRTSYDAT
jgi:hypothetical protein